MAVFNQKVFMRFLGPISQGRAIVSVPGLICARVIEHHFPVAPSGQVTQISTYGRRGFAAIEMVSPAHQAILTEAAAFFKVAVSLSVVIQIRKSAQHVTGFVCKGADAQIDAMPAKTLYGVKMGTITAYLQIDYRVVRPEVTGIQAAASIHNAQCFDVASIA